MLKRRLVLKTQKTSALIDQSSTLSASCRLTMMENLKLLISKLPSFLQQVEMAFNSLEARIHALQQRVHSLEEEKAELEWGAREAKPVIELLLEHNVRGADFARVLKDFLDHKSPPRYNHYTGRCV